MSKKFNSLISFLVGLCLAIFGWILINKNSVLAYVLIIMGIATIVFSVIAIFLKSRKPQSEVDGQTEKEMPEYRRKNVILSRPEWEFLQILKGLMPIDKYEIDVQVPLITVIDKLTQNSYRNELFRVIDFLVVDSFTYAPLLFIELNDASHKRADRIERDKKVATICERAGMPLISFWQADLQDINFVKKAIYKNILKK